MPPPSDIAQVIDRVQQARSLRDVKPLTADLASVPDDVVFAALFPVAVRSQGSASGPVAMSAYVLHARNPKCPLPVDVAVASLLPTWDVSIEEVPWYLLKQFGREAILAAIARLGASPRDEDSSTRLQTIAYWISVAPPPA